MFEIEFLSLTKGRYYIIGSASFKIAFRSFRTWVSLSVVPGEISTTLILGCCGGFINR